MELLGFNQHQIDEPAILKRETPRE